VNVALPAEARAIQHTHAGLVSRVAAASVDLAFVSVAVGGVVLARSVWRYFFGGSNVIELQWPSQLTLAALGGVVLCLYLTWGWARTGRTLGKRVLGLALTRITGERVGWPIAALRAISYVVFPLGLLWSGISTSNRSLQDLVFRTAVVYDWRGARRAGREARPA